MITNHIMTMPVQAHEYLLQKGIRPSVQRLVIMDYLLENRIHPTADGIYNALYKSMPTLSKTTVYNTLKLFVEQEVIQALVIDEKNVRFDINTSDHAHFHCLVCDRVYDVWDADMTGVKLDEIDDFIVTQVHLYYKGYCKKCFQNKGKI